MSNTTRYRHEIEQFEEALAPDFFSTTSVAEVLKKRTQFFDQLLTRILRENCKKVPLDNFCLVASGSYGRNTLNLNSDLDLILLHHHLTRSEFDHLTQILLVPLHNAGLKLSAMNRSLTIPFSQIPMNLQEKTASLEARMVCGNASIFTGWKEKLSCHWSEKTYFEEFIRELQQDWSRFESIRTTGSAEPDVKECAGGLRDYTFMYWFAQIANQELKDVLGKDYKIVTTGLDFLWLLRECLHRLTESKSNILTLPLQTKIAELLQLDTTTLMQTFTQQTALLRRTYQNRAIQPNLVMYSGRDD